MALAFVATVLAALFVRAYQALSHRGAGTRSHRAVLMRRPVVSNLAIVSRRE
jgi:hypothetical protein